MGYTIAIAGKGGVGKTTCAAMLIHGLIRRGCRPVLAVDADPNRCLDAALGVTVSVTIGGVREEARELAGKGMAGGISKQQLLELKIAESLVEAEDFDLIAMGRPEGPGCYCYANNVLKNALGRIADAYPYTVLDNEAGLENLSRRLVQRVDLLVLVTDPSQRGIETLRRLHALAAEMEIAYGRLALIINRLRRDGIPAAAAGLQDDLQADALIGLPDDNELADYGECGRSLTELPNSNAAMARIDQFLSDMGVDACPENR